RRFIDSFADTLRLAFGASHMAQHILVLHGPNLNLLGSREPHLYGSLTLAQINQGLEALAAQLGVGLTAWQSNHEGALVERIQAARQDGTDFIVINAAAYTHTSVAVRDAWAAVAIPFVEVHLSNLYKREPFRQHSHLSDLAVVLVCGLGADGYEAAVRYAARH